MTWRLSLKTKLGNVYHLACGEASHCDHRIKLTGYAYDDRPDDGRICGRCENIAWHMAKNTASPKSGDGK